MPFQSSHLLVSQMHYKDGDVSTMVLQIFIFLVYYIIGKFKINLPHFFLADKSLCSLLFISMLHYISLYWLHVNGIC